MSASRSQAAVLLLCGATCSGKTELAIALAERFGGEIVGADSRQIYRGMPIGTAAPSSRQRERVPHHLVAFLDPQEHYSAARFVADAGAAIVAIQARGRRVVVVGGTGFYLRALAGDVALSNAYDPVLRERLVREARIHPPEVLHAWLAARDSARATAIAPHDGYRVTRALEVALTSASIEAGELSPPSTLRALGVPFVRIALDVAPDDLAGRIAARTDRMLADGLVEEAERIGAGAVAATAVGYPQALAYLAGYATRDELRAHLLRATSRYAKRQRTWFRGEPDTHWLPPERVAKAASSLLGW